MMNIDTVEKMAKIIDHTNLKPKANRDDIKRLCNEAIEFGFGAVCVNPCHVKYAKKILDSSDVEVCSVIGFPLGATLSSVKAFEAKQVIENGATEVDMVMNVGALKSDDIDLVERDIKKVVEAADGNLVKVILETCLLTDEEVHNACEIVKDAGADFVKTSTGFSDSGATVKHIKIMKKAVGDQLGIKASGGIRAYKFAKELIQEGATRIGASSGIKILEEMKSEGGTI